MKKSFIALVLGLTLAVNAYAQDPKKEQIKALKIAYITDALQLDSNSAERLWPVYNKYEQKYLALRETRSEINTTYKTKIDQKTLTEAEAEKLMKRLNTVNTQLTVLETQRLEELRKTIGAVKTLALKKAENEFHKDLVKKISKSN